LRLVVIGNLGGRLTAATRIARDNGAPVRHADNIEAAVALCAGEGADLLIVDAALDIRSLGARLHAAGITAPVVACGIGNDAAAAVAAMEAGAREHIPLTPDPEVIAAILAAVVDDGQHYRFKDDRPQDYGSEASARAGARMAATALEQMRQGVPASGLVGRTVADVERDLILETLKRCFGNRTHAASILGISIRTLRNKLAVYAAEGIAIPPPNHGDLRGAA
jgi:DNA-binding NtrC family response regulator